MAKPKAVMFNAFPFLKNLIFTIFKFIDNFMHMYVPNLNHFRLPITLSHCLFFPLKLCFQKFFLVL